MNERKFKFRNYIILLTIGFTVFNKLLAMLKESSISFFYGASNISDAYITAVTIPITFASFIGASLNTCIIPMYTKFQKSKSKGSAEKYLNSMISFIIVICTVLFILVEIFAYQLVWIFASGFQKDTIQFTAVLVRFSAFIIYAIGISNILAAYIQLIGQYHKVVLANSLINIFAIIGIVISSVINLYFLIWGFIIGYLIELFVLIIIVYKSQHRFKFVLDKAYIAETVKLVFPVILGSFASDINIIIDKNLSSNTFEGGITLVNYASKVFDVLIAVFVTAFINIAYPAISNAVASKNKTNINKIVYENIIRILLPTIPCTVGGIIFSLEIVNLLYIHGSFTLKMGQITATLLSIYMLGLCSTSLRKLFVRILYSYSDTKTPAVNTIIVIILNTGMSILLSKYIGLSGIVLGTSISSIIGMIRLGFCCSKKLLDFELKKLCMCIIKLLIASITMGYLSRKTYIYLYLNFNQTLSFLITIILAITIYFCFIILLGMKKELKLLLR